MRSRPFSGPYFGFDGASSRAVDYILFLTADVTVTPNLNEIRDYKYVSKEELKAMFEDPSKTVAVIGVRRPRY